MTTPDTDPEDQLLDRLIALIDDHVYAEGSRYDRWVEGIDEAAAAIIDEFDVREHDGEAIAIEVSGAAEPSLQKLIAAANRAVNGPKR